MQVIDLTGQKFGKLTVLKEYDKKQDDNYTDYGSHWVCQCSCGNITIVRRHDLISKKTTSCGCYRKEQLSTRRTLKLKVGDRFGKLVILEYLGNNNGNSQWKCKCDCGNIIQTTGGKLNDGNVQSCGCLVSCGELLLNSYLQQLQIPYQRQYSFPNLLSENNHLMRFDFVLFNTITKQPTCAIEFDGIQHFQEVPYFAISLNTIQKRDLLKNNYCKQNNIGLIRFNYKELESKILTFEYFKNKIQPYIK